MTFNPRDPLPPAGSDLLLQPRSKEELCQALRAAHAGGHRVGRANLRAIPPLLIHVPEDMTVTVSAGVTLTELQSALRQHGQWLPLDPPNADALTVGDLLATNASGPRRFGYGTVRDYLIGVEVALADGKLIHSGGKVVKNVAGYDLLKLFIGDHGSLGVVLEATFKLLPLPEAEQFLLVRSPDWREIGHRIVSILDSKLTPAIFDLHGASEPPYQLTLGFAGSQDEVVWQLAEAADLGFSEPATLEHEFRFHAPGLSSTRRASVLPSRLVDLLGTLSPDSFVARAGNGVVYYRGGSPAPKDELPLRLLSRVKETFDPKHVFPDGPA